MALLKHGKIIDPNTRPDIELANDANLDDLDLSEIQSIALNFPSFSDGRAFSQARRLRSRGFAGDIWAMGEVTPDLYAYMVQCGFTVVEADLNTTALETWQNLAAHMKLTYQRDYDTTAQVSIHDLRAQAESPIHGS